MEEVLGNGVISSKYNSTRSKSFGEVGVINNIMKWQNVIYRRIWKLFKDDDEMRCPPPIFFMDYI